MSEIKKFESEELSIIKVNNLKALKEAGETLQNLVKDNPFIDPTSETIGEAEKSRKSLKIGRTTVNRYETELKKSINDAKGVIIDIAIDLRTIVEPAELKQAAANNKYFDIEAWEKAKEIDTKEAYVAYIKDYSLYLNDANLKIEQIEEKEAEAKLVYNNWVKHVNQILLLAKTTEQLDDISGMLDSEDCEKFIDPQASFDKREEFYDVIDLKRADIEKAETERKEREAKAAKEKKEAEDQRIKLEKEKIDRDKKEEAEKIKREKEAAKIKKERQIENLETAEVVLDSVDISIDNINDLEKVNLYAGKLENTISKDFGTKDEEIKTAYTKIKTKLDARRNEIVSGIQKVKAEAEKAESEKKLEADKAQKEIEDKAKADKEKELEDERLKNAAYAKQKSDMLLQIKGELTEEFKNVVSEHQKAIEKYNLKQDIINFISELL